MFKVGEQDDGSGPEYESRPLAELSFTQQYIASLYWATTTVSPRCPPTRKLRTSIAPPPISFLASLSAPAAVASCGPLLTLQVTTVGYGDIVPANPFEMGIACLVEFLGVLVFGLLIGTLSAVFIDNSRDTRRWGCAGMDTPAYRCAIRARKLTLLSHITRSQLLRDRLQEASEWMNACHLPKVTTAPSLPACLPK